jgi:hypothetical protein
VAVYFIPKPLGIALIARTPFMANAMEERAGEVAAAAKAIAPRGPGKGGHYADMIDTAQIVAEGVAGARVNAWKFTSGFIEFGTSDTPTFAPLRLGCDAAGLSLTGAQ